MDRATWNKTHDILCWLAFTHLQSGRVHSRRAKHGRQEKAHPDPECMPGYDLARDQRPVRLQENESGRIAGKRQGKSRGKGDGGGGGDPMAELGRCQGMYHRVPGPRVSNVATRKTRNGRGRLVM